MELNSNQIQEINPHRYPFALVDRITDYKPGEYAKGIKCVSVNEMHFCGHFPSHHVMPGVLIVEALAQVGCIAILSKEEKEAISNVIFPKEPEKQQEELPIKQMFESLKKSMKEQNND